MSSNTLTVYVIGVLIAWAVVIAVGYFLKGSTAGHRLLLVCGGFLLGTLAMYIATRVHLAKSFRRKSLFNEVLTRHITTDVQRQPCRLSSEAPLAAARIPAASIPGGRDAVLTQVGIY